MSLQSQGVCHPESPWETVPHEVGDLWEQENQWFRYLVGVVEHNGNLVRKWQQQANSHSSRMVVNIPWEFPELLGRDKRVVRGLKSCVSRESRTSVLTWAYLHTNKDLSQRLIPICNCEFVFFYGIHVSCSIINYLRAENLFFILIFLAQSRHSLNVC